MPVINPQIAGSTEVAINFFESNVKKYDSFPHYACALKPQLNSANNTLKSVKGFTEKYPASKNYKKSNDDNFSYFNKVNTENNNTGNTKIPNMDMTEDAAASLVMFPDKLQPVFNEITTFGEFNSQLNMGVYCELAAMIVGMGIEEILKLMSIYKTLLALMKMDLDKLRKAFLSLIAQFAVRALLKLLISLDMLIQLVVDTAYDQIDKFVNMVAQIEMCLNAGDSIAHNMDILKDELKGRDEPPSTFEEQFKRKSRFDFSVGFGKNKYTFRGLPSLQGIGNDLRKGVDSIVEKYWGWRNDVERAANGMANGILDTAELVKIMGYINKLTNFFSEEARKLGFNPKYNTVDDIINEFDSQTSSYAGQFYSAAAKGMRKTL